MSKLSTERLELKVRALGDADALLAIYSDPDVSKFIGNFKGERDEVVKAIFMSDTHWRKNGFGLWTVFLKKTGELIGTCGLRKLPPPSTDVELVIHLAKKHWKKGIGTEACQAVLKFGFDLHKLPRIVALVDDANTGSIKLLTKLGFKKDSGQTYILTK
jgi:ribosomal-protein-alanine N-acetyltransferase